MRLGVKRRNPCSLRSMVEDWKMSVSTATVMVVSSPSAKSSRASSLTSESVARANSPISLNSSSALKRVELQESRVGVEGRGMLSRVIMFEPTERANLFLARRNKGGGEEEERLQYARNRQYASNVVGEGSLILSNDGFTRSFIRSTSVARASGEQGTGAFRRKSASKIPINFANVAESRGRRGGGGDWMG